MKLREITDKTDAELGTLLNEQSSRLEALVIEMRTKKVTNVKEAYSLKKTIARIMTIQRQRAISRLEDAQ